MIKRKPQLIVALDVDTFEKAKRLIDKLYPKVKIFKVGSQLFTNCGPKVVEYLSKKRAGIFLDLKYHDIPNTVALAVRQATRLGVGMMTLHICGREEMLAGAVQAAKSEAVLLKKKKPLLIGVTILTSQKASAGDVLAMARKGLMAGLDGVVSSVKEAAFLKENIKKNFVVVTPGIRPQGAGHGDQKRVATPTDAVVAGSDFLVVGRPIVEAPDPLKAAEEILKEINKK